MMLSHLPMTPLSFMPAKDSAAREKERNEPLQSSL